MGVDIESQGSAGVGTVDLGEGGQRNGELIADTSDIEQKVLGFSLDRIEEIVRLTTQRELDVIVRLGFLLGGLVGLGGLGVGVLLRL